MARRKKDFTALFNVFEVLAQEIQADGTPVTADIWLGDAEPDEDAVTEALGRELTEDEEFTVWEWADSLRSAEEFNGPVTEVSGSDTAPRGGMLTYSVSVLALTLPSGVTLYAQIGDAGNEILGVARTSVPAETFLKHVDAPLDTGASYSTGSEIDTVESLLAERGNGSFRIDNILDGESQFLDEWAHQKAENVRTQRHEALLEAVEAGELEEGAEEAVLAAPAWFFLLEPDDLAEVTRLPVPDGGHAWRLPAVSDFDSPQDLEPFQHIVAAYVTGQRRF